MTEAIPLPDGWYWLFDHGSTRQHWYGHVSGARVIVMDGTLIPSEPMLPQVLVGRGNTAESRHAADTVCALLRETGYSVWADSHLYVHLEWRDDAAPPRLVACRDQPPFTWPQDRFAGGIALPP